MKVLFLGFGLAHYFNDLLNTLQVECHLEVVLATVRGGNPRLGAGVHETRENVGFRVVELEEEDREPPWSYPLCEFAAFEKPRYCSFPGLPSLLAAEKPDVLVACVDTFELFTYDRDMVAAVARLGIKTVFHSIPFQLPTYQAEVERCRHESMLPMRSLPPWVAAACRGVGLAQGYARCVRRRTLMRPVNERRRVFGAPEAHVCYHEGGLAVYGSYGVSRDRIHVVRNSPDTDKLFAARRQLEAEGQVRRDPRRLIHVGRLVEWKRVDMLLQAVAALRPRFPGLNATIVGRGPQEGVLRALAGDLGISDAITFTGAIYDAQELARQFLGSAVYVLAGMGGLSINEAMCFGLPVVCSVCDGTELFLVRDGITGVRFREGDLTDLCNGLAQMLSDPEKARAMGLNAEQVIRNEINIHILAGRYMRLFDELTAR